MMTTTMRAATTTAYTIATVSMVTEVEYATLQRMMMKVTMMTTSMHEVVCGNGCAGSRHKHRKSTQWLQTDSYISWLVDW